MLTMKEETRAIKKALNVAGYECSVKKGVGSARGWIYVAIRDRPETREENEKIAAIVFSVDGRRWREDNLSIEFSYFPYVPMTCGCGATGTGLHQFTGPDDLIRTRCRACGALVI
jgi:hypothetical protein